MVVAIWLKSEALHASFCDHFRFFFHSLSLCMQQNHLDSMDRVLIEELKKQIERSSKLENEGSLRHRDYEFLVFFIEDSTGSRISLSTLKRIWKDEYQRVPHVTTLDILSQAAYQKSWLELKKQWSAAGKETKPSPTINRPDPSPKYRLVAVLGCLFVSISILFFSLMDRPAQKVEFEPGKINFACKKSVEESVPNSVVFSYDVKSITADSFFIQQSWDKARRVRIDKQNTKQTDIYYTPGYFMAQLIADQQVIKEIPVHITNKDWFIAIRQPLDQVIAIDKAHWLNNGQLGITPSALTDKISLAEELQLGFYRVEQFEVDGDNFSLRTNFRMDSLEFNVCPTLSIMIKGEHGLCWVMFGKRGCESELWFGFGEVQFSGKTNDLTPLGTDIYHWQKTGIVVEDRQFRINLNGRVRFTGEYQRPLGAIKEISYFFQGIGSIDELVLRDSLDNIKFADDFELPGGST